MIDPRSSGNGTGSGLGFDSRRSDFNVKITFVDHIIFGFIVNERTRCCIKYIHFIADELYFFTKKITTHYKLKSHNRLQLYKKYNNFSLPYLKYTINWYECYFNICSPKGHAIFNCFQ